MSSIRENVRRFCRKLKFDAANVGDIKQLVRASGSVGANYIEVNENAGQGDWRYRIKVCRKESKVIYAFPAPGRGWSVKKNIFCQADQVK